MSRGSREALVTRAWVARSTDYGEADRVVVLLTESRGRVSALARSARRSRKRFGGALSLFVEGRASLKPGRGELYLLEAFDCVQDLAPAFSADLVKVTHGSYVLELARELWPEEQAEGALYALVGAALDVIAKTAPSALTLRAYELQLLRVLGFIPALDHCARCDRLASEVPAGAWAFSVTAGGSICPLCGPAGWPLVPETQAVMRWLVDAPLAEAAERQVAVHLRRDLRDLLQMVLGHHLGKSLKSWEFIAQLVRA